MGDLHDGVGTTLTRYADNVTLVDAKKNPARRGFIGVTRLGQARISWISTAAIRLPSSALFWNSRIWSKFM